MIHVLEFPAQGAPRAWFAFDSGDFIRKAQLCFPRALADRLASVAPYDEAAVVDFWGQALAARPGECAVWWNDDQALAAFEDGGRYQGSRGAHAREALRQQLVELELLEGV